MPSLEELATGLTADSDPPSVLRYCEGCFGAERARMPVQTTIDHLIEDIHPKGQLALRSVVHEHLVLSDEFAFCNAAESD
jgi:hypothetical protein